ncbi:type I-E CRISPR-associated protein Cse1/CasA [Amycolatopsis sp. NPDC059657]|uniref:type I-E CRISPR-associated protein Cse1/CasA n=1 Tax=Amycolatopsis sp. NPDC059657 TaxID=3346899 RepID=UPI003672931E
MNEFDLVDEPWLLAHDLDGQLHELSLIDVFRRAGALRGLAGDVPTQVFALTRLLLAVLHGTLREQLSEDLWEKLWRAKILPVDDIERYLDESRGRFDLFHPDTPFLQVSDLHTAKGEVSELSKLIADVPNGHPFFSNRVGRILDLSYAEAARWLVHCHAFDPSGIKSGAVGDEARVKSGKGYPIGTGWSGSLGGLLPHGATLLETLLLNLMPTSAGDCPAWDRPPLGAEDENRAPTGHVDLFVWQSRRIRLAREGGRVVGVLICQGSRVTPQNKHGVEIHTAWRRSQAQEKKLKSAVPVYMPLTHDPERLVWRGLQAMLPSSSSTGAGDPPARIAPGVMEWISKLTNNRVVPKNYPLQLRAIGVRYGSNESVIDEIVDDAVSLQAVLLDQGAHDLKQVVLDCVRAAEDGAYALGKLAVALAEASGSRDSVDGYKARASELAYAALDPLFRAWLAGLGPDSESTDSKIAWHTTARSEISALGQALLETASPQALTGRMVRKRWITAAHADVWFRRSVNEAFPMAHQEPARSTA